MQEQAVMSRRKRALIFASIITSGIVTAMLITALNTALPSIIADFNVNLSTGQWITSGYSLAMGCIMPLTAFLITTVPTRTLYLTAIIAFLAGVAICAFAPWFWLFMVGRILQACGNGIIASMSQVVLLSIYPPEKRGTVMGWFGLSVIAIPVLAPTAAGIIIDIYSWRAIFYISLACMALVLIFALAVFSNVLETAHNDFDLVSFFLSIVAFGGITLAVENASSGVFDAPTAVSLAAGAVTAVLFVLRQLHSEDPFLEMRVLKCREFTLSVIGCMLLYFTMMGSSILMPVYAQTILGRSATISALIVLPGSLFIALISPFAGKLFDRIGIKKLFVGGSAFLVLSNVCMYFIRMDTPLWVAILFNLIRCVALGFLMMPLLTWGISALEPKYTAHGSALLSSLRTIAGAIGTAVFVGIMTWVARISATTYGHNAMIHGFDISFLLMGASNVVMLAIAVFAVHDEHKRAGNEL